MTSLRFYFLSFLSGEHKYKYLINYFSDLLGVASF